MTLKKISYYGLYLSKKNLKFACNECHNKEQKSLKARKNLNFILKNTLKSRLLCYNLETKVNIMKKDKYCEILIKLNSESCKTKKEKIEYLESVIESTDYDGEGWNDELIALYNKIKSS